MATGFDNYTTTTGSSTTKSSSDSTTKSHEVDVSTLHQRIQNMDDASLAALDKLISDLQSGGTTNMKEDRANRLAAILSAQQQQQAYSKEAALKDAQGAMDGETRRVMESLLPSLTRSAEGAGTSQNSMRALLLQQGAQRAAESASSIGLKAAADYGNVQNGISSILAQLVAMKDPAADALLQALGIAKGAVQITDATQTNTKDATSNTHTTGTSTTNSNSTTTMPGGAVSGGSSGGSRTPLMTNMTGIAPVQALTSIGPVARDYSSSGLGGLSYGSGSSNDFYSSPSYSGSGQSLADYIGLPSSGGNFADQFTFGTEN